MNRKIDWPVLKALHTLYSSGQTAAKVQGDDFIKYLLLQLQLLDRKHGKPHILVAAEQYAAYYQKHIAATFDYYQNFFDKTALSADARKTFSQQDIQTLMFIWENRQELAAKLTNIEDFSAKIFDFAGSKYLKQKGSVRNAVLQILGVTDFPQNSKEFQWRFVVDYTHPEAVILCENRSFLKQPWLASELKVKLWQVGGNNIGIINDIDHIDLQRPIYYSCDWDYDGLSIFSRIKARLQVRGAGLTLLSPSSGHNRLPSGSFAHNSRWQMHKPLSGLIAADFTPQQTDLIQELIHTDHWIEEESNDLAEMYRSLS
ncbi:hypothetical protein [Mucilaginibacter sp.]|uniref:hypothetical protein n=1 Tax=Mucilaginibacter sp. TaxID=1882438 RepID=UPI0026221EBD|nr:hypothetical protein [Mucilaginibacter sp.]MDB4922901.1 hypothetical protein [Mucilaginibacter sp.]